jgi:hypothetical protein
VKKARKGESSVSLYDAEGYSALKRSRERGEADSLAPLLTIVVSYPGSYSKIVFILYVFEYSMDFLCFAHCEFSGIAEVSSLKTGQAHRIIAVSQFSVFHCYLLRRKWTKMSGFRIRIRIGSVFNRTIGSGSVI